MFGPDWSRHQESGSPAEIVCRVCCCATVRVFYQRRRQRKGESCLLSWSLPWVAKGWLLVTGNARLAMRPERWVEYAADDLRGRVKFLHNRKPRWKPAVPQPEQDAQREQLRWSHSPAFHLLLRNLSFCPLSYPIYPPLFIPLCLSSTSSYSPLFYIVPLLHRITLSPSLAYSQLFALSQSLILCEKRAHSFSAQQRGRIRHFLLNQGICSCLWL